MRVKCFFFTFFRYLGGVVSKFTCKFAEKYIFLVAKCSEIRPKVWQSVTSPVS